MPDREDLVPYGRGLVHPTALIRPSVILGEGSVVWAYATIHEGVIIGDQCSVGEFTYIGRNTRIGDRTRIGAQCHITDHMTIGRSVFMGPMVTFSNVKYPIVNNPNLKLEPPLVGDDVSIGVNATILPQVILSDGCSVGAGAVVTKSVGQYQIVVGNPAKPIKKTSLISTPTLHV